MRRQRPKAPIAGTTLKVRGGCSICNREGHAADKCPEFGVYPEHTSPDIWTSGSPRANPVDDIRKALDSIRRSSGKGAMPEVHHMDAATFEIWAGSCSTCGHTGEDHARLAFMSHLGGLGTQAQFEIGRCQHGKLENLLARKKVTEECSCERFVLAKEEVHST